MVSLAAMLYEPEVNAPRLSPNGRHAAWHSTTTGRPAIHVASVDAGGYHPVPQGGLIHHQPHVFCWAADNESLWINRQQQLLRVTLDGEIRTTLDVGARAWPKGCVGEDIVYENWSRRDADSTNLIRLDPKSGKREPLTTHSQGHLGVAVHPDGRIAYLPRPPGPGMPDGKSLPTTVIDPAGERRQLAGRYKPIDWHGDALLLSDPSKEVNVGIWTPPGQIDWIGAGNPAGFVEEGIAVAIADHEPVRLPGEEPIAISDRQIQSGSVRQGRGVFITTETASEPASVIGWDGRTGSPLETPEYAVPPAALSDPETDSYPDSAGEQRDTFVLLPEQTPAPCVIHLYGIIPETGPFDRKFGRPLRYLREQGYACLLPARGGTRGNSHRRHADYAAAAEWAREQPWSNGEVVALGHSSGGYDVLMQAVHHGAAWTAGVAWSSIVDRAAFYDLFERDRAWIEEFDDGGADRLAEFSPINYIEQVDIPLFLIHGAHEDFQPETRNFVDQVRSHGIEIDYFEPARIGHWTKALDTQVHIWSTIESYLASTLKSRREQPAFLPADHQATI